MFPVLQVNVCGRVLWVKLRTEPEFHEQIFPVDAWTKEWQEQATLSQKQSLLECFHIHVSFFLFLQVLVIKTESKHSINEENWLRVGRVTAILAKKLNLLQPQILVECLPCAVTVLNAGEGLVS